jgi:hypothetical protein
MRKVRYMGDNTPISVLRNGDPHEVLEAAAGYLDRST